MELVKNQRAMVDDAAAMMPSTGDLLWNTFMAGDGRSRERGMGRVSNAVRGSYLIYTWIDGCSSWSTSTRGTIAPRNLTNHNAPVSTLLPWRFIKFQILGVSRSLSKQPIVPRRGQWTEEHINSIYIHSLANIQYGSSTPHRAYITDYHNRGTWSQNEFSEVDKLNSYSPRARASTTINRSRTTDFVNDCIYPDSGLVKVVIWN